ncbi:MAG: TIR domain-containing protein [Bradyrhizobium sp.]
MPPEYRRQYEYDFFVSRRGSVGKIAQEVADVLLEKGYRVIVQDYDFQLSDSVIERMHEGLKNSRDLIVLSTSDYEQSAYTRKEFTSFEAQRLRQPDERHTIILRCEDISLEGLLADVIYQDLVGIDDADERRRRIIAAAERQPQAAPPPSRPFIGVPPRIPSFTGREDHLSRLDEILIHDRPAVVTQAVQRVAVQGMGGVGKTSLAVEYAHRYRGLYAGVCWCPTDTREGLFAALRSLGTALGYDTSDAADPEATAKALLHRLAEQRANWLLVYDNVASPNEIVEFLPSAGARVLITSRFLDWTGLADEIGLDTLSPEEAMSFVQSRAGRQDTEGARILAEALGYLPLALDHAAAYCKRAHVSFEEYAKKAANLMANAPRDVLYPRSVAATFDLALSDAEARCPAVEEVMAFLGYCAPTRVPIYFLQALTNREEAIIVLAELSLIRHDPYEDGIPAVTTHRLVQAVARHRTEAKGKVKETLERVSKGLSTTPPPSPRKRSFLDLQQLIPQLRSLAHQRYWFRHQIQHLIREFALYADKYERGADQFDVAGYSDKAKKAREKASELREKASRLEGRFGQTS